MNERIINADTGVGAFVLLGLACVVYLAINFGELSLFDTPGYELQAHFVSVSGLREGAAVEIAGVPVGQVKAITLEPGSYQAVVSLSVASGIELPEDTIASVRTAGIIGDKFIMLSPGGSETVLKPGDELHDTESSVNLEELISKYIFQ